MRAFGVIVGEPQVERLLHLVDGLEPRLSPFDAEVLVEHGAVEALDDAVRLRPAHLGGAVFDLFELQEQLVGVLVGDYGDMTSIAPSPLSRSIAPVSRCTRIAAIPSDALKTVA